MSELLTPRQVARAMDLSESTIKRWCDRGTLPVQLTAGGHRRIALADVVRLVRDEGRPLPHPEALGLPSTRGRGERVLTRARQLMTEALLAGEEDRCRQVAVDLLLAGHALSAICDEVLGDAFRQIGRRWACGEAEVYQERRGCEIAQRVLHELRRLVPLPAGGAPLALGCSPGGDPYSLGSTMAELVLRGAGWNAVSLGENLPLTTLAAALRQHRPRLCWLSCSHLGNVAAFLDGYGRLYDEFASSIALVVGGYALTEPIRQQMKYAAFCDRVQHLEGFVQSLDGPGQDAAEPGDAG